MGQPISFEILYSCKIIKSERGELKHLSSHRKGHKIDSVSSGERRRTRPMPFKQELEHSGKFDHRG
jgi:hypothetical protein